MKVLVVGPDYYHYTQAVARGVQALGHDVLCQKFKHYTHICNYFEKKLLGLGFTQLEKKYYENWNNDLLNTYRGLEPDLCLICNGDSISPEVLQEFKNGSKLVLWLFDSVQRSFVNKNLSFFQHIYTFDPRDVAYINEKFGIAAKCINMGYDSSVFYPQPLSKDIDLCFVGASTQKRLSILRQLAEYAFQNNKNFVVYGRYWDDRCFGKRNRFARKYPPLQSYIKNTTIHPDNVAQLYSRSRICINIHIEEHEGINPRTFEILGTKSFQLVDHKEELWRIFTANDNLVAYRDTEELLEKVQYYLENDFERETIALRGYEAVEERFSVANIVRQIVESY